MRLTTLSIHNKRLYVVALNQSRLTGNVNRLVIASSDCPPVMEPTFRKPKVCQCELRRGFSNELSRPVCSQKKREANLFSVFLGQDWRALNSSSKDGLLHGSSSAPCSACQPGQLR